MGRTVGGAVSSVEDVADVAATAVAGGIAGLSLSFGVGIKVRVEVEIEVEVGSGMAVMRRVC